MRRPASAAQLTGDASCDINPEASLHSKSRLVACRIRCGLKWIRSGGFKKGQSGNPGGRPRALVSVMEEARKHTLEAICTLELMRSANSESVRLNAAEAILSRGWGRPVQAFQVDGRFANRKLNELSAAELAEFEKRLANAEPQQQISEQGCAEG
jgi:Family of unknown function (DUF5681)